MSFFSTSKWKLFAAFALITTLALGCAKEYSVENRDAQSYYVRFTIDGVAKEYTNLVTAIRYTDSITYSIVVRGDKDLSPTPESMAILVEEAEPVTAKVYTELSGSDSPAMQYRDSASTNDFSNLYMVTPSGIQVIISQIDSIAVRGSFRGTIADINGNTREITDGEFHARFQ